MGFADDLLEQAQELAKRNPPNQASLRRAVSTAYYALFHLLIDEAVSHWAVERQRSKLARTFEHDKMKRVCGDFANVVKSGGSLPAELNVVVQAFIQLQQHRHTADYDNSKNWSSTDVDNALDLARDAFQAWNVIKTQDAAQDFLLTMFLPKPARQ